MYYELEEQYEEYVIKANAVCFIPLSYEQWLRTQVLIARKALQEIADLPIDKYHEFTDQYAIGMNRGKQLAINIARKALAVK